MDPSRFLTHSLRDARVTRTLAAALDAVEPGAVVRRFMQRTTLPTHQRVFLLGIGKAAEPMTTALAETLGNFTSALIITKHILSRDFSTALKGKPQRLTNMEAGHPLPDARSLAAGQAALDFVSALQADDLLICLISGGGSALVTAPSQGISLEDTQALTSTLLACGATIDEINILRRRLDRVKGGGLAQATKARVLSLILSDVVGNRLEDIASGPTAPDPTTREDALAILQKYKIEKHIPAAIVNALKSAPVTLKPDDPLFERVENIIVGDNALAAQAARGQAETEGFHAEITMTEMQGEAREVGQQLATSLVMATRKIPRPFCLLAGGETTVTLRGNGRGGRNQELALASVPELGGVENVMLAALATDGDDGPTDAAGAVATGETRQRAEKLGMDAADYLSRNDAYPFFESLGDLLKPGYSGTNVNDLIYMFGF